MYDEAAKAIALSLQSLEHDDRWGPRQGSADAFGPLGFGGATFFLLGHPTRGLNPRPLFGLPIPEAWSAEYQRQGLVQQDVAMARSLRSADAFTWSEIETAPGPDHAVGYFEACRRFSADMLICPMTADDGAAATVGLWMDAPRPLGEMERAMAQSLAALFATLGQRRLRLPRPPAGPRAQLSRRELQCLYWVANGKSDLEIGELLGLSGSTVHHYVEGAKHKLQARSRVELVHKAAELGLIFEPSLVPGRDGRGPRGGGD